MLFSSTLTFSDVMMGVMSPYMIFAVFFVCVCVSPITCVETAAFLHLWYISTKIPTERQVHWNGWMYKRMLQILPVFLLLLLQGLTRVQAWSWKSRRVLMSWSKEWSWYWNVALTEMQNQLLTGTGTTPGKTLSW